MQENGVKEYILNYINQTIFSNVKQPFSCHGEKAFSRIFCDRFASLFLFFFHGILIPFLRYRNCLGRARRALQKYVYREFLKNYSEWTHSKNRLKKSENRIKTQIRQSYLLFPARVFRRYFFSMLLTIVPGKKVRSVWILCLCIFGENPSVGKQSKMRSYFDISTTENWFERRISVIFEISVKSCIE